MVIYACVLIYDFSSPVVLNVRALGSKYQKNYDIFLVLLLLAWPYHCSLNRCQVGKNW